MNIIISSRDKRAMTMLEAICVIVAIGILVVMLAPVLLAPPHHPYRRIQCASNLRQVGVAYRVWANDNGEKYPAAQQESLGGCQAMASNAYSGGTALEWFVAVNFSTMQNELGQSPKLLLCPADDRVPNTNFYLPQSFSAYDQSNILKQPVTGSFCNTNVSYWVGIGSDDTVPQSLLGGDRNMGTTGAQGTTPDNNYGFSGQPGWLGGIIVGMDTNAGVNGGPSIDYSKVATISGTPSADKLTGLLGWSRKMHSGGTANGAGNILMGDGSVQQISSGNFRVNWMKNAVDYSSTNTARPGCVHYIFP